MEKLHRIRVKLGVYEFEAEGIREVVEAQYAQFMSAVASHSKENDASEELLKISAVKTGSADDRPNRLSRMFKVGDVVSLLALPKSEQPEADALILLIYGFEQLKQEGSVSGVTLMKAAKQSGVGVSRIDRVIDAREDYYNVAGAKKGRRYSLNNRGIQYAEGLIAKILQ